MASEPALRQAIAALRGGDRASAHTILQELTAADPQRADLWLWLAASSADKTEKRVHLLRAFTLAPEDRRVIAGLRALGEPGPDHAALPAAQPTTPQIEFATQPAPVEPVLPAKPLARARFGTTGVRNSRPWPWLKVALVCVVALLIPLTVWLI